MDNKSWLVSVMVLSWALAIYASWSSDHQQGLRLVADRELQACSAAFDDLTETHDKSLVQCEEVERELRREAARCLAAPIPCAVPGRARCFDDAELADKTISAGISCMTLFKALGERQ